MTFDILTESGNWLTVYLLIQNELYLMANITQINVEESILTVKSKAQSTIINLEICKNRIKKRKQERKKEGELWELNPLARSGPLTLFTINCALGYK